MPAGGSNGNSNGSGNGPTNGDILNALSGDVTIIKQDTGAIRDNTDPITDINKNVEQILRNVNTWSQQDVRSRIYDASNNRGSQPSPYNRNRNSYDRNRRNNQNRYDDTYDDRYDIRNRRSKWKGKPEDFLDSFFEELEKNMFGASFKSAMQQNVKEFAAAMGLQASELPAAFGKQLADQLKKTDLAKRLSTRLDGALEKLWDKSMKGMRKGIDRYYDRARSSGDLTADDAADQQTRWEDLLNRLTERFSNRHDNPSEPPTPPVPENGNENNPPIPPGPTPGGPPTPNPEDGQGGGNEGNKDDTNPNDKEKASKILEDKLQYLYTIHNTLNSINEGVKIIADSIGTNDEALSKYGDLFKKNNEENDRFIEDILSQGQGKDKSKIINDIINDSGIKDALGDLAGSILEGGALDVGAGLAGVAQAAMTLAPEILLVVGALWLVDKALDAFAKAFDPVKKSFDELVKTAQISMNRFFESEKRKIQDQTSRLRSDVEVLVKKPFEIMEAAANDWYNTWDSNLKTINATQGYTKADLQTLMANYSERLRSEGLESYVSAADISTNLAKVLESGLSGAVAEEFAYLATVLGNAIPTQDFFGYASTYATIAANQIAMGKSQSEAIQAANDQLTQFASSLLYSSRQLAGGFSTGLSNASDLLTSAVKIATTAGIGDSSIISATLAAVSSVIGAIAPDLSGSLTDAIVDAALGGNSDTLVALRSLANTGASNTAFLNAFARDPKRVLSTLFTNLARMQNINNDNFMEVAESLASTFGLSIGALTRVNFASLAQSVENINISMDALNQNMELLQDGQTTTTAEQLKMQKINEMILDEGLSYVLDNEAARAIQQHMWDQELAAELQETTYSVELQGKVLEFIEGIHETINNIFTILNPLAWISKIGDLEQTLLEDDFLRHDIAKVLEAGKVGSGNRESLYNLTTYDVDKLTNKPGNLLEMMGGTSQFRRSQVVAEIRRTLLTLGLESNSRDIFSGWLTKKAIDIFGNQSPQTTIDSQYNFSIDGIPSSVRNGSINSVPKSFYTIVSNNSFTSDNITPSSASETLNNQNLYTSTQAQIDSQSTQDLANFLATMQENAENYVSFSDWASTSIDYGISNLESALEATNLTLAQVEGRYQQYQAAGISEYSYNKDQQQFEMWDKLTQFLTEDVSSFFEEIQTRMDTQIELMTSIDASLTTLLTSWQIDWLQNAWGTQWLKDEWDAKWIQQAWYQDWLSGAWGTDWLANAWRNEWLTNAWQKEWVENAWRKEWLEDAWASNWLDKAWNEAWLQKAWSEDWLRDAWQSAWIDTAWKEGFIDLFRNEWIQKAWKEGWIDLWQKEWLENAWQKNWIDDAWKTSWIDTAWNKEWLENAWGTDWLQSAWQNSWLDEAWNQNWLEDAWKNEWLQDAWKSQWLEDNWQGKWLDEAWNGRFIDEIVKGLWKNQWEQFFNIFRDRFGGIDTAQDGTTSFTDTADLYQIYSRETGAAALNSLTDVEDEDETGDAILALVKQLTQNTVDLRDPQVQTNVLLSQILIVLEAIMQAENTSGGASLATTLASLGLGMTTSNLANSAGIT